MFNVSRRAILSWVPILLVVVGCSSGIVYSLEEDNVSWEVLGAGDGDGAVLIFDTAQWICQVDSGLASGQCRHQFYDAGGGGVIQFTATADPGSVFEGWTGDCTGGSSDCSLGFLAGDRKVFSTTAAFLRMPAQVTVTLAKTELQLGESTLATGTSTASGALSGVEYTWQSSDPTVVSVSGSTPSNTATVTAVGPGTAEVSAEARGVRSAPVTVTVAEPGPEPAALVGTVVDTAGTPGIEGLIVRIGGPTPARDTTDAEGSYEATGIAAGAYTVYVQGRLGFRFMSTEVHQVGVAAGSTVTEDMNIKEGNYFEVLSGSNDVQATAGATVTVALDFMTWSRSGCPACAPALILGVDGEPQVLHRFEVPGTYPGARYSPQLQLTAPAQGGTLYAMLVTGISTVTDEGKEAARNAYRERFANGLYEETFVPIGTLTIG